MKIHGTDCEAERQTLKAELERLRTKVAELKPLCDRITEYLLAGGLVNPEMMEHEKVRDLLIDIRAAMADLRTEGRE